MLRLDNVSLVYDQREVLRGITLEQALGTTAALIGESGAGKSTLLKLVAGLDRPASGAVSFDGQVWVSNKDFVPPWKRKVGMVFQDLALWPHMTVLEHVLFGFRSSTPNSARKQRREESLRLLDRLGLAGLGDRLPYHLSGGQQQRTAMARALSGRPALLLLDEAFNQLDADSANVQWQVIEEEKAERGMTVLFASHQDDQVRTRADAVYTLNCGALHVPPRMIAERSNVR